jgi:hypothetical protein
MYQELKEEKERSTACIRIRSTNSIKNQDTITKHPNPISFDVEGRQMIGEYPIQ